MNFQFPSNSLYLLNMPTACYPINPTCNVGCKMADTNCVSKIRYNFIFLSHN